MSTRDIEGESEESMAKTFVTSLTKCWKHANRSKEAEDRTAEADRRLDISKNSENTMPTDTYKLSIVSFLLRTP